jgi:hypothetical protein
VLPHPGIGQMNAASCFFRLELAAVRPVSTFGFDITIGRAAAPSPPRVFSRRISPEGALLLNESFVKDPEVSSWPVTFMYDSHFNFLPET